MKLKKNWRDLLPHKSKLSCAIMEKDLKIRNDKFRAMSTKDRNIEVALDCLTMLDMGKIVSQYEREAKYWSNRLEKELDIRRNSKKAEAKRQEKALCQTNCDVCQIGAVMLSKLRLGDNIAERDTGRICSGHVPGARDYLDNIEESYEHRTEIPYLRRTPERMANNFLNVIHNDGEYRKSDKKDYLKDILI